jgi:hypothetical protein
VSEGSEPPDSLENVVDDGGGGPPEVLYESEGEEEEAEELVPEVAVRQQPPVKAEPREEEAKQPPVNHFLDELLEESPVSRLTIGQRRQCCIYLRTHLRRYDATFLVDMDLDQSLVVSVSDPYSFDTDPDPAF